MELGKIYRCIRFGTIVKCVAIGRHRDVKVKILAHSSRKSPVSIHDRINKYTRYNYNLEPIGRITSVVNLGFEEIT